MTKPYSHSDAFIAQLKSIEQKINRSELPEAALQLNHLSETAPNDPRLFLLGSRMAQVAGNPEGMLLAARKAYHLAPQWPTSALYLASILAGRNEADEAMKLAENAIQQATMQATLAPELLSSAAKLALQLEKHSQALRWLRQAEEMNPSDIDIRYKIGLALSAVGDFTDAIHIFTDILSQRPSHPSILSARRQAAMAAQNFSLAIKDGEELLAMDPMNGEHQYYLAIARGETPSTQPASVVELTFNGLAALQYDQYMVVQSKYQLPRDVAEMIKQWYPDRKVDVLDLGCGTGLLGVFLGRIQGALVGVDLSESMLEKAGRHHLYDSFHQVNVLDALECTPDNLYRVIAALDLFSYVGELGAVIPNAHRILTPNGYFVFSCEAGADADYALQRNFRYAHQRGYVQHLLQEAGFQDIKIEDRVLRYENDQPLEGFVVTARKQAHPIGRE